MTVMRLPADGVIVHFTPTPGRRVSFSSSGIDSPSSDSQASRSSFQCHRWPKHAPEALRLLHEHDAHRRAREHVEAGESDDVVTLLEAQCGISGCQLGEDDRELAVGDERGAGVDPLAHREAAQPPGDDTDPQLADERGDDRDGDDPAEVAPAREVDRQRERKEEQRCEDVAHREEPLLDLFANAALRQDHARHQSADRLGELELHRDRAHRDHEAEDGEEEELELEPAELPADPGAEETRGCERRRDEHERLRGDARGLRHAAAARRDESEHRGDGDVLEEQDREHEVRFVVREAPEVDQCLHRDRARGDVDAGGEDKRGERRAERDQPDEEAEPDVDDQVSRAAQADVTAAPHEPLEAELQPEEEQKEDQPDLGDEVRHLRRLDELDDVRLVRPEDDPGEEIRGDRGEPEPTRRKPENAKHSDGDGELGERHPSTPSASRLERAPPTLALSRKRRRRVSSSGGRRQAASAYPTTARRTRSSTPGFRIATTRSPGLITVSSLAISPTPFRITDTSFAPSGSEIPAIRLPAAGASGGTWSSTSSRPSPRSSSSFTRPCSGTSCSTRPRRPDVAQTVCVIPRTSK